MYTYTTILPSPYTDKEYYLSPEFAFYYIQEAAGRHAMRQKVGIPHLLLENKSWVILHTHLEFYKKPYWQAQLQLSTYAFAPKGIMAPRVVDAVTEGGEKIFHSYSLWGVVEASNGHHRLINPQMVADKMGIDDGSAFPMPERLKRFDTSHLECIKTEERHLHYTDIDINGHLNNLKYSSFVISSLPEEEFENGNSIKEMDILFSKELYLDDTVEVKVYKDENSVYYVAINDACFSRVKFGEVQKLEAII